MWPNNANTMTETFNIIILILIICGLQYSVQISLMHVDIRLLNSTTKLCFENEVYHQQIPKTAKMKRTPMWKWHEGTRGWRIMHKHTNLWHNRTWGLFLGYRSCFLFIVVRTSSEREHFAVVCLVTWPLKSSEAGVHLALNTYLSAFDLFDMQQSS